MVAASIAGELKELRALAAQREKREESSKTVEELTEALRHLGMTSATESAQELAELRPLTSRVKELENTNMQLVAQLSLVTGERDDALAEVARLNLLVSHGPNLQDRPASELKKRRSGASLESLNLSITSSSISTRAAAMTVPVAHPPSRLSPTAATFHPAGAPPPPEIDFHYSSRRSSFQKKMRKQSRQSRGSGKSSQSVWPRSRLTTMLQAN